MSFVCPVCGRKSDNKHARVCHDCGTTVCEKCAAKRQNFCGNCFSLMGYIN